MMRASFFFMPFRFSKTRSKEATYLYILAAIVGACTIILGVYFLWSRLHSKGLVPSLPNSISPPESEEVSAIYPPCVFTRSLDGVCVETKEEEHSQLIGVMIENAVDARPLTGLAAASVVYEAPVEANIPRFLALYPISANVKKVGPVRSARPYFVSFIEEYPKSLYAHVGGSPAALDEITHSDRLIDVNEMTKGWYFWRSDERRAPHNTYISSALWQKAAEAYEPDIVIGPWTFARREPCHTGCTATVTIDVAGTVYDVSWMYNTSTGQYERFQGHDRHRDEDGTPIHAGTVIVARMNVATIDAVGRKEVSVVGEGKTDVYAFGEVVSGKWQKKTVNDPTRWVTADGAPIALAPGPIWIEILPPEVTVTTTVMVSRDESL